MSLSNGSSKSPKFKTFNDDRIPKSVNSWQAATATHGPRKSLPGDEIEEEEEERHCCSTFCCCVLRILPNNMQHILVDKVSNVAYIVLCAVFGIVIGLCFGGDIDDIALTYLKLLGDLWLAGLNCVVLPFILTNMVTSVSDVRALKGSKNSAKLTFFWYFLTTLLAVTVGVLCSVTILLPNQTRITVNNGSAIEETMKNALLDKGEVLEANKFNTAEQPAKLLKGLVPKNFVKAMADNSLIAVIVVGIVIGLFIETKALNNEKEQPSGSSKKTFVLIAFMREVNKLCFQLISILVAFTPIGVLSLVAGAVAKANLVDLMKDVGLFLATVLTGLVIHAVLVYPTLFFLLTRSNPFPVMKNVLPAFLTAMSTSSSAATFPVTYRNTVDNNHVRPTTAKFVLSLGMTMNMDGTAIGFPIAVIFMASAVGMELSFGQILGMALTASLASMGAGPIPSAGLVLLVSIMESVGIASNNPMFGLIVAVDWVYDRPETAVNIFGDSLGAVVVDRSTAKANEDAVELTNV